MRKFDVAYVPNGPVNYYPAVPLQDMSLDEIVKKYIKTCAKANGKVSECSKCKTPCPEGKRAIQLVSNEIYNDPPIPLYGGKTLIEKAKEENMRRRKEKEEMSEVKEVKHRPRFMLPDNWYELSLQAPDQVEWLVDKLGCSRTQAKKKIYSYRYRNGLTDKNYSSAKKETKEVTVKEKVVEEPKKPAVVSTNFEDKMEKLMFVQEQQKKVMDSLFAQYEKAKSMYEATKHKIDILCSAVDILNDM